MTQKSNKTESKKKVNYFGNKAWKTKVFSDRKNAYDWRAMMQMEDQPEAWNLDIVKVVDTNTTGSYCIEERAMRFIVDNIGKYPKEVDVFYAKILQKKFDCYCIVPHMTKQLEGYSDIQGKNVSYKLH